jgi:4-aminobutyrate aminotransferase-like enzyme
MGESDDTIANAGGLTHAFTYSHHLVGAAVGRAVLRVLRDRHLVEAATVQGKRLLAALKAALGEHPAIGDIRGLGLMTAIELVADSWVPQLMAGSRDTRG